MEDRSGEAVTHGGCQGPIPFGTANSPVEGKLARHFEVVEPYRAWASVLIYRVEAQGLTVFRE